MSSQAMYEQLDGALEAMLRRQASNAGQLDPTVSDLLAVGDELRQVSNPQFRERLRVELQTEAAWMCSASVRGYEPRREKPVALLGNSRHPVEEQILPTLFGVGTGGYPVLGLNFAVSALVHAAAIALVLMSSVWVARHPEQVKSQVISLIGPGGYTLPPAKSRAGGGGGGGGDHDRLRASKGTPPRFAQEQITPPAIMVRNENPKLTAEPTVVGPPELKLPQSAILGDPLSRIVGTPSNGIGGGGGIGSGEGGGVGNGMGPGVGPGHGGGVGGGVYRVGGGVSAPRVLYDPDPEYSEEARQAKYQGTVVLWVVIGPDGYAREIRVQRTLGMVLDEKAIDAVRKWRFEPAMKDGRPVAVQVNVEVNFRLY